MRVAYHTCDLKKEDTDMRMNYRELIDRKIADSLISLFRSGLDAGALMDRLKDFHEHDIAQALEELTTAERRQLCDKLGAQWMAEIFPYYDEPGQLLAELSPKMAAAVTDCMDSDEAAWILDETPEEFRAQLVGYLQADTAADLKLLSSYGDDEIGSLMSTNYISILRSLSVKEAMKELIRQSKENDNISTLYVVDEEGVFCGAIDLKDLILAREGTSLSECTITSYPFVRDHDPIEEAMDWTLDYEEDSLPVLDQDGKLAGVITSQDMVDYLENASKEVYNKLAGISEGDDDDEDIHEPLTVSLKKRMPWLIVLLFLGMFVSSVVGMFEGIVAKIAILVCFQSLILDMAGNVGTQSLAVTIRVLMDDGVTFSQCVTLIWKEVKVGIAGGALLGAASVPVIGLYICLLKDMTPFYAFSVAGCVGLALVIAMTISSFAGTVIPLFFHKIKVDPAVASGPLITTVNDLVAVIAYYGTAWLMLIRVFRLA